MSALEKTAKKKLKKIQLKNRFSIFDEKTVFFCLIKIILLESTGCPFYNVPTDRWRVEITVPALSRIWMVRQIYFLKSKFTKIIIFGNGNWTFFLTRVKNTWITNNNRIRRWGHSKIKKLVWITKIVKEKRLFFKVNIFNY